MAEAEIFKDLEAQEIEHLRGFVLDLEVHTNNLSVDNSVVGSSFRRLTFEIVGG